MRNAWKMPSGMCFDDERASPKELRNNLVILFEDKLMEEANQEISKFQ